MMRRGIALLLLVAALSMAMATSAAANESPDRDWLALGDSFSSGEGISGTARPGSGERECARATGVNTDATAWAVGAYREVQDSFALTAQDFVPCSGAVIQDADDQIAEALHGRSEHHWNVVSFTFGGNNLGFSDIIKGCINLQAPWGALRHPGCDVGLRDLERRIDILAGRRTTTSRGLVVDNPTLSRLYDRVAEVVAPGGDVLVVGYPQLFEEPMRWARWRRLANAPSCEGVLAKDVPMLRTATSYLNDAIRQAVSDANARHRAEGVRFHFVDVAHGFESTDRSVDRHGLCSEKPWLNGRTLGGTSGDLRSTRSFHPKQLGHDAIAKVVANVMRLEVQLDDAPPDGAKFAQLGVCAAPCRVTGLVPFDHPTWGASTLVTTLAETAVSPGQPTREAHIVVVDSSGAVRWRYNAGEGRGGWTELATAEPAIDKTGHIFVNYNPGRYNGVIILNPSPDGFQDFATLPPAGDFYQRFYSASLVDEDHDGVYEVLSDINYCVPSCAASSYVSEYFEWNGQDYKSAGPGE